MKTLKLALAGAAMLAMCACGQQGQKQETAEAQASIVDQAHAVTENILTRRSVRKYKPQPVGRDTMQVILKCGINAPNGQNKQSWEVRVVDNPEFIDGITALYKQKYPAGRPRPFVQEHVPQRPHGGVHRQRPLLRFLAG